MAGPGYAAGRRMLSLELAGQMGPNACPAETAPVTRACAETVCQSPVAPSPAGPLPKSGEGGETAMQGGRERPTRGAGIPAATHERAIVWSAESAAHTGPEAPGTAARVCIGLSGLGPPCVAQRQVGAAPRPAWNGPALRAWGCPCTLCMAGMKHRALGKDMSSLRDSDAQRAATATDIPSLTGRFAGTRALPSPNPCLAADWVSSLHCPVRDSISVAPQRQKE